MYESKRFAHLFSRYTRQFLFPFNNHLYLTSVVQGSNPTYDSMPDVLRTNPNITSAVRSDLKLQL